MTMGRHMRSGPCVCVLMDVSMELERREKILSGRVKTCTAGELRLRRRERQCGGRCEGIRGLVRAFLALLARFLCLLLRALELEALRDGVAVARAELALCGRARRAECGGGRVGRSDGLGAIYLVVLESIEDGGLVELVLEQQGIDEGVVDVGERTDEGHGLQLVVELTESEGPGTQILHSAHALLDA